MEGKNLFKTKLQNEQLRTINIGHHPWSGSSRPTGEWDGSSDPDVALGLSMPFF